MKQAQKYVYFFGHGKAEGHAGMKDLLGGKGAGLCEMTNLGVPVPCGFIVTTEACILYYKQGKSLPEGLDEEVQAHLSRLEESAGKHFGDKENPLLVSIRSGARVSMPGMMDTVLNVGLNDITVQGLAQKTNNPRFAYDSYRRFIAMFSSVVLGIPYEHFEVALDDLKKSMGVDYDTDLDADALRELVKRYKGIVESTKGAPFPSEPNDQLWAVIKAVFESWNSQRATTYRKIHKIPDDWGTAVSVVSMVFGNMGDDSGTGVLFTRNPATGEKALYGEYLPNAQGEDVVAGIRTPYPISKDQDANGAKNTLEERMPAVYREIKQVAAKLEAHYKDMQDIEFTIEKGNLWILQTRSGKRTALAAMKAVVDMVQENLIDKETAILRISPDQLNHLLHPVIDPRAKKEVLCKGLPASPGAVNGMLVFTADEAVKRANMGDRVILVRPETSPEDIHGMYAAQGILTARGGMTSHAAVVARGMGKCCIVGCSEIRVSTEKKVAHVGGLVLKEGDWVTLNGSTGEVMRGIVPTIDAAMGDDFVIFMEWVDAVRRLRVRANADTSKDCEVALRFGAEGVGLCRTEHMFFAPDRILAVREMILSNEHEGRKKALAKIKPMQKGDFAEIFRTMGERPVIIRLLDPPLHEFLPKTAEEVAEVAREMRLGPEAIKAQRAKMEEFNPMLGHRGCRLGITTPEIYEMQIEAILEAACELKAEGLDVHPEIMVPLVGTEEEIVFVKACIDKTAKEVMDVKDVRVSYKVGTMIELPRACIVADDIAKVAEFFSFGTNDLTQMTFGFSRDDVGIFLPVYLEKKILKVDPFESLDTQGVGQLIQLAVEKGRKARAGLSVGICGEHGGDSDSVKFCHKAGLDYVSCSPFRVPIAKLAAAQAVLEDRMAAQPSE
ncbi:MAG: pyruvate, phosphate dikinase [Nitrospirota bacterium]|nr:pyruvate, phosphate dikinase [Nitrospirota bacterium]